METQRLILLFIFGFSLLMLWEAWDKERRPKPPPVAATAQQGVPAPTKPAPGAGAAPSIPAVERAGGVPGADATAAKGETLQVRTDVMAVDIDTLGGTLKRVELLKHKDSKDSTKNLVLLGPEHQYEAQSGLTGEGGPNHRTLWRTQPGSYSLEPGKDSVEVRLTAQGREGLTIDKVYTFRRNSYVVDIGMEIRNQGSAPAAQYAYFQLTHDGKPDANLNTVAESFGAQSYTGFAAYSDERKFEKEAPSDLDKGKADVVKHADNGWLEIGRASCRERV